MSRIGKLPIHIPQGVQITVSDENLVTVKGKLGELSQAVDPSITLKIEGSDLIVERPSDDKQHKAFHGLYRSLIANMVKGVSEGFKTVQELVGVGYKVTATEQILEFALGYSHNIIFELPPEVKATAVTERGKNPIITLQSTDKQLIGQVAAKIRSLRKPEPYKGKGIKFIDEVIKKKAGKSASEK
ncbi:MAG TPA: 50S ribosomal protein L6 [Bacteroidales bacterium]|jgi:large subunit ribosomal protein L6|nr:50S ribosomal protein L6 [Bacteroidales bacterium]HPT03630.1 50S ribosomal protein L6 [Bacteroidales bacterium]